MHRASWICLVLLGGLTGTVAAGEEPVPQFAEAVAQATAGKSVVPRDLDPGETARLRARAQDASAPMRERAVALALLGRNAPGEVRGAVHAIVTEVRRPKGHGFGSHAGPPPIESVLHRVLATRQPSLTQDHVPWLAHRAFCDREPLAVGILGWIPGDAARAATLAFVPDGPVGQDPMLLFSLDLRLERFPEERAALLARARMLRTLTSALAEERLLLLQVLARAADEPTVLALDETLAAMTSAPTEFSSDLRPEGPGGSALVLLQALSGHPSRARRFLSPSPPVTGCGPSLARLVERRPELIQELVTTLVACAAPVAKPLLWSRLGNGRADESVVRLLLPRLEAGDEAALVAALDVKRFGEASFYLRIALALDGPEALLTPAVHEALWAIAEAVVRTEGGGGRPLAAGQAVRALERFGDPADTARLDRLSGTGGIDPSTEALCEVLRRSADPLERFLALLDDDDPARREAAEMAIRLDGQSHYALSVPRTLENWRRIVAVLERRMLRDGDTGLRHSRLQAHSAATVPGPLSPMYDRTPEDDLAVVTFYRRLLARDRPPALVRGIVARMLMFSRRAEALELLDVLRTDEDADVAHAAHHAAEQVRAALGK